MECGIGREIYVLRSFKFFNKSEARNGLAFSVFLKVFFVLIELVHVMILFVTTLKM